MAARANSSLSPWLARVDAGFTKKTCAHYQNDSLSLAAERPRTLMTQRAKTGPTLQMLCAQRDLNPRPLVCKTRERPPLAESQAPDLHVQLTGVAGIDTLSRDM